jgi:hypothetical protein
VKRLNERGVDDWWEDKAIWKGFRKNIGARKGYWLSGTAYLGGWSGHPHTHGDRNVLVFRQDGIAYRGFQNKRVIPWDQVVAIDVEGPDSPSDRVTATRLATIGGLSPGSHYRSVPFRDRVTYLLARR